MCKTTVQNNCEKSQRRKRGRFENGHKVQKPDKTQRKRLKRRKTEENSPISKKQRTLHDKKPENDKLDAKKVKEIGIIKAEIGNRKGEDWCQKKKKLVSEKEKFDIRKSENFDIIKIRKK